MHLRCRAINKCCCAIHQWILFMTERIDIVAKRTDRIWSQRLHLRCCTVEANYWQTQSIARPLCYLCFQQYSSQTQQIFTSSSSNSSSISQTEPVLSLGPLHLIRRILNISTVPRLKVMIGLCNEILLLYNITGLRYDTEYLMCSRKLTDIQLCQLHRIVNDVMLLIICDLFSFLTAGVPDLTG